HTARWLPARDHAELTPAFSPGPGFIAVRQSFTLPDLREPGFVSVDSHGDAVQQIAVTWV
ncbi:MAG TPA: hypothetical protein VJO72_12510, partial [Candidatus Dormibacteraeota bacterium]|nr:hypothetical protein [Candidatus Dormibacteraeota bacterium]